MANSQLQAKIRTSLAKRLLSSLLFQIGCYVVDCCSLLLTTLTLRTKGVTLFNGNVCLDLDYVKCLPPVQTACIGGITPK